MTFIAKKLMRNGQIGVAVYRNDDGTAHIVRHSGSGLGRALEWNVPNRDPEWFIANNGPNSQHKWRWADA
jgi:hypothetical protein